VAVTPELISHAVDDSDRALGALIAAVRELPDGKGVGASALPGWTRGHVLAHVDGVGRALARQAEYAARGETITPYDGGRPGRDAAIEAGSRRTMTEHVAELETVRERLRSAWPEPGSPPWSAPVEYRDGVVADALLAWWREVRIHAVDARVGIGAGTWDAALLDHLREFLAVRLPDDAADLELVGAPTDVTAWLAGRQPDGPVAARRDGVEVPLPELGPWPAAGAPGR